MIGGTNEQQLFHHRQREGNQTGKQITLGKLSQTQSLTFLVLDKHLYSVSPLGVGQDTPLDPAFHRLCEPRPEGSNEARGCTRRWDGFQKLAKFRQKG